jgi:streptogramin lyase
MRRRTQTILSCTVLCFGVVLAARGAGPATEASELKVTIREWNVPTKGAHPHDPAVGVDGALWFTEQMVSKIGRLDPKSGAFKEYALKVEDSGPHGLVCRSRRKYLVHGKF